MEPADRCDWCERTVPVDEFKYGPTILMERPDLGIYSQEGVRLCSVCQFALQMGPKWDTFLAEHGAAPEFFHWLAGKMSLAHPDVVARTLARRGDGNANVF